MQLLLAWVAVVFSCGAQDRPLQLSGQFNVGVSIYLNVAPSYQTFPSYKVFVAGSLAQRYSNGLISLGTALCAYRNSVGNNVNPLVGDIQIDWINSVVVGGGGGTKAYPMMVRTMGNAPFYNLVLPLEYGGFVGTNAVLNNHGRNQLVGSLIATAKSFSFVYYNDGAPPFSSLGLSDSFDRWWTGGGCVFVRADHRAYNALEICFDQFTGFSPLLYEVSGFFGIDVPQYENGADDLKGKSRLGYNTSAYSVRIGLNPYQTAEIGLRGSMRWVDKYGLLGDEGWVHKWGVQDIIHGSLGYAIHPNQEMHRFYMGGTLQLNRSEYAIRY